MDPYSKLLPGHGKPLSVLGRNNFLGGKSSSRPLGDAILDGIDFDIKGGTNKHWDNLAHFSLHTENTLRSLRSLSCVTGDIGNLESEWKQWISIPAKRIFLGLPAAVAAAGSGFIPAYDLTKQVLPAIKGSAKYGGVTLWCKYYDDQTGYSVSIKAMHTHTRSTKKLLMVDSYFSDISLLKPCTLFPSSNEISLLIILNNLVALLKGKELVIAIHGEVATYLWYTFLGGKFSSCALGESFLDGIDFDAKE
ncbi:hypothetical protein BC332_25776 [Capsicum chinense]|nr:hypothetical protein BC332_25776 [Capsicum chinense]